MKSPDDVIYRKYLTLRTLVENLEPEIVKFAEHGNKAAAGRFRKGLQTTKKLAQELRTDTQQRVKK